ncbi:hypothetical protein CY35_11G001700 [Sphagnum magellanicum]|nr:hypothetical protein CY35_11G001700 [Sphagnum magellanicum]
MDEDPCELPNSDSPLLLLLHPDKELWSTLLAMPCDGSIQLSKSTWFTWPATYCSAIAAPFPWSNICAPVIPISFLQSSWPTRTLCGCAAVTHSTSNFRAS